MVGHECAAGADGYPSLERIDELADLRRRGVLFEHRDHTGDAVRLVALQHGARRVDLIALERRLDSVRVRIFPRQVGGQTSGI
eukprot:808839-Prymnesium_polylepis.1